MASVGIRELRQRASELLRRAEDGDLGDLPEPLVVPAGTELPSAALARLRQDER